MDCRPWCPCCANTILTSANVRVIRIAGGMAGLRFGFCNAMEAMQSMFQQEQWREDKMGRRSAGEEERSGEK